MPWVVVFLGTLQGALVGGLPSCLLPAMPGPPFLSSAAGTHFGTRRQGLRFSAGASVDSNGPGGSMGLELVFMTDIAYK